MTGDLEAAPRLRSPGEAVAERVDAVAVARLLRLAQLGAHRVVVALELHGAHQLAAAVAVEIADPDDLRLGVARPARERVDGGAEAATAEVRHDAQAIESALGVAEDAARKRVSRAAEKMRTWMGRRGSVVTGALLVTMLETRMAEAAAPASLMESVLASAATPQSAVAIADESLSHIWWDQARRVMLYVAAAIVIAVATGFIVHSWMHYEPPRPVEHIDR